MINGRSSKSTLLSFILKCGNIQTSFLLIEKGFIERILVSGSVILRFFFTEVANIGAIFGAHLRLFDSMCFDIRIVSKYS